MGDSKKEIKPRSRGRRSEGEAGPGRPSESTRRDAAGGRAKATTLLGRGRRAAVSLFAALAGLLRGLYTLARRGLRALEGPTAGLRRRASALVGAASRAITPTRGLLLAALGCALLLGLSQFADYRGVAIGVDGYDPEIQSVAPAPEVDRAELGTAHAYLMVPAALIAIAILLLANRSGRWQLCRLAALIGVAAVVVAIVVDRPAGLDEGTLVRDFTGVEAKLLGGFWVQLVAGVGLAVTSLLLGTELRRGRADRAPAGRQRRPRTGTRGSGSGRASGRGRRARADGAGA